MDFIKSAVANAISKGPPFPYTFGERVDIADSIWTLHNGTKREDNSNCSIFSFDITANRNRLQLAKNALRKLRTLRHPGVVRVLDTVETETYIYIATERITPLSWHVKRKALNVETIKWGLFNTAKTLKFINEDASSIHGNLRVSSIFTTESGEWKLAGFEVLSSVKDEDAVIYNLGGLLPDSHRYSPPEVSKGGWGGLKDQPVPSADAYLFAILIYEAFNGSFMSQDQLATAKSIPQNIVQGYRRLLQPNPKTRLSIAHFLAQGTRSGSYFDTPLIRVADFVENMGVKGESEREEFLNLLEKTGDQFPEDFFKMKVLPELLKAVEFGGGGPKVFAVVMKIGEKLTPEEYEAMVVPVIVRLFSIPDRAIRVFLLDNLPRFIEHVPNKVVNDKIFPDMMTGFTDVAPVVREQSVKAVLTVIGKLSDRNINGDLLRYLAKTQNDEQPGIRTNTTICLGKIAKNLGQSTRAKVLTAAFTRSLRDPFVHARNAALLALAATAEFFDENDCAGKILPALCLALIDKEKIIRVQAQKTLETYLNRVKQLTANMPDSVLPPPTEAGNNPAMAAVAGAGMPRMGTPQTDASWAGWAISSFTKTLGTAVGELQSTNTPSGGVAMPGAFGNGVGQQLQHPAAGQRTVSEPTNVPRLSNTSQQQSSGLKKSQTQPQRATNLLNDTGDDDDADAWGAMDDGDDDNPFSSPSTTTTKKAPVIDDDPWGAMDDDDNVDFAKLVQPKKKELPKGLGKPAASSSTARAASPAVRKPVATTAAVKKPVSAPVKKPVVTKTTTAAAKKDAGKSKDAWGNDDEEDGWGNDGW